MTLLSQATLFYFQHLGSLRPLPVVRNLVVRDAAVYGGQMSMQYSVANWGFLWSFLVMIHKHKRKVLNIAMAIYRHEAIIETPKYCVAILDIKGQ